MIRWPQGREASRKASMTALIARLCLLVSVLLMPLGMAAPASAAPHSPAAHAMPSGHCDGDRKGSHDSGGIAECTMACAAMLPAQAPRSSERLAPKIAAAVPSLPVPLQGLDPETATPPPRIF